jgi:hypothetical protein
MFTTVFSVLLVAFLGGVVWILYSATQLLADHLIWQRQNEFEIIRLKYYDSIARFPSTAALLESGDTPWTSDVCKQSGDVSFSEVFNLLCMHAALVSGLFGLSRNERILQSIRGDNFLELKNECNKLMSIIITKDYKSYFRHKSQLDWFFSKHELEDFVLETIKERRRFESASDRMVGKMAKQLEDDDA